MRPVRRLPATWAGGRRTRGRTGRARPTRRSITIRLAARLLGHGRDRERCQRTVHRVAVLRAKERRGVLCWCSADRGDSADRARAAGTDGLRCHARQFVPVGWRDRERRLVPVLRGGRRKQRTSAADRGDGAASQAGVAGEQGDERRGETTDPCHACARGISGLTVGRRVFIGLAGDPRAGDRKLPDAGADEAIRAA